VVQGLPQGGGLGERAEQTLLVAVLVQPVAEPGPAADQCLVGDLHVVAVDGQQPGPGGLFEEVRGVGAVVEFVTRDTPGGKLFAAIVCVLVGGCAWWTPVLHRAHRLTVGDAVAAELVGDRHARCSALPLHRLGQESPGGPGVPLTPGIAPDQP
jgi:hypothetical protein